MAEASTLLTQTSQDNCDCFECRRGDSLESYTRSLQRTGIYPQALRNCNITRRCVISQWATDADEYQTPSGQTKIHTELSSTPIRLRNKPAARSSPSQRGRRRSWSVILTKAWDLIPAHPLFPVATAILRAHNCSGQEWQDHLELN